MLININFFSDEYGSVATDFTDKPFVSFVNLMIVQSMGSQRTQRNSTKDTKEDFNIRDNSCYSWQKKIKLDYFAPQHFSGKYFGSNKF